MIYPTVGMPSRFSEWCEAIFRQLLAKTGGPLTIFAADGLDQISKELLFTRTTSAVVVSRQPQQAFSQTLIAAKSPVMITLDRPDHAVGALMRDHNERFADAVRHVANALTSLLPLMRYDGALVLRASDRLSAREVAARIAQHFALGLDEATIRDVAGEVAEHAPPLDEDVLASAHTAVAETLSARARSRAAFGYGEEDDSTAAGIVGAALDPLWSHVNGDPLREVFWHPLLFSLGDHPAEPAIATIDVTGARRCLLFGPYIRLPEGPWSCSLLLGCAKSAVGAGLTMDIYAGTQLNSVDVVIGEPGLFEIELPFVNRDPDGRLEVRLISAKASFEGELMAGSVRLTPQRAKRLRAG